MKSRLVFAFHWLNVIALLVTLFTSATYVTPAHAISMVVNSNADTEANDGVCTLREAIIAAVSNLRSGTRSGECAAGGTGVDNISFAGNYTITVGSQLPYVTTSMTITGKGAGNTIVQAATAPNIATWRVFQVTSTGNLNLDGVTVRNGRCNGSCTILGGAFSNGGGGIFNDGTLTVTNSVISGNIGEYGAGIDNEGTLTVINSTFSGNAGAFEGGGIRNFKGGTFTLTVINSTFLGNTASLGGGIFGDGSANIANSTFSGNTAFNWGGGISAENTFFVINSTFSGNTAAFGGAGINNANEGGTVLVVLRNTIVANNSGGNCLGPIFNGGNNLDSGTSCGFDFINLSMSNTDPMLGPLADNGGPTQTMKLLTGSPAIDTGDADTCRVSPVSGVDQRGVLRPQGAHCDIGAFETSLPPGPDTAGVFRPSNGLLYLKNANTSGFADIAINYGTTGDYPVVGDWDGDGDATIGIYRNGVFYLRNANTIGYADLVFAFGSLGDQPVAGDWDGDGEDTIGVYRNGTFFLRNSNSSGAPDKSFALGIPGDVGIAGDWNGDTIDTTGVFRPSNGALYLKNTNTTGFAEIQINYGLPGDKPVTGDWNADGIDTIGVYRNGMFLLRNSNTIGFAEIQFALGIPGDHPIAGNWDGVP